MKSTMTLLLVGLLFVSGFAFAQGMRVEKKKEGEKSEKVEAPKKVEDEVEIELELGEPQVKKTVEHRVFILGGDAVEVKGKIAVAQPGEKVVVIEKDGTDELEKVIADLKKLREQIKAAKTPQDLEKLAKDLQNARVRVHAGRKAIEGSHHVVRRRMGGAHPMPQPAPRCQHCAPRAPARPQYGQARPGPMGPMMPMMLNGLRQSIDGLRGEIAGLRQEIRSIRGVHAPKAPGAFHFYGAKGGSAGVAVKKAPPKPPSPPTKAMVVGKGGSAAGGAFVGRAPVKPDPRQARLEQEVKDLRAEMAAMKDMLAQLLHKMDAQEAQKKTK